MTQTTLLPCPFCGCADVRTEKTITDGSVWCAYCGITSVVRHDNRSDDGQDEAVKRWNRRAKWQRLGAH